MIEKNYLVGDRNCFAAAEIFSKYLYAGSRVDDNHKEIQCDLLNENNCIKPSDLSRLSCKKRLRWHLKEFCNKTSMHGVPMLERSPNTLYRVLWITFLVVCASTFAFQSVLIVLKYQRNDKNTIIELKFDTAEFPAITICNLNPYKYTSLKNINSVAVILNVFNAVMMKANGTSFSKNDSDPAKPEAISINDEQMWELIELLGFANMSDELAIIAKAKENLIYRVSELPISQRIKLSVEKKELIQKCSFNGAACDIDEDFALVFDSEFGNCYTYNHNKSVIKSSLKAGPMYGLRLLLQVNASEYLPTTEAVGVKIVVHGKEEYPFPQKMYRLPAPFGECTSQKEIDGNSFQGYHYSTEGCYRSCFQRILTEKCGCGEPRLPLIDGTSYCQIFSANDRRCLERYTNELNAYCECHQPCNQSIYSVSYSEARWPSKSLNITVGNCDEHHERCNEYFEENGVMLEVFYEILNFEELREYEAYGVVKMLSDFGGHLGLWSGISFITCCEILLMIAEALYMITERYCRKYRSKK